MPVAPRINGKRFIRHGYEFGKTYLKENLQLNCRWEVIKMLPSMGKDGFKSEEINH